MPWNAKHARECSDLTSHMEKEMRLGEGWNERVIISQGDGCVSDASLLETGNGKKINEKITQDDKR
jgi:hypothetical protein